MSLAEITGGRALRLAALVAAPLLVTACASRVPLTTPAPPPPMPSTPTPGGPPQWGAAPAMPTAPAVPVEPIAGAARADSLPPPPARATAPVTPAPLPPAATNAGTASGAAATPAAPAAPQSAFAAARASSGATGDYFHDFGELILRVRSVRWIEEICSQAFPDNAAANARAYDDWRMAHAAFVDEVENQFTVIGGWWADASPAARQEGLTVDQLQARVDANRDGLRQDLQARGVVSFSRRCQSYPAILQSPQLDLEQSLADYVTTMRAGPR